MPHPGELFQSQTAPLVQVPVGASPLVFTAPDSGRLVVQGGLVDSVELGRNGTYTLAGTLRGSFNLSKGDQVRITYSTWFPSITFFRT